MVRSRRGRDCMVVGFTTTYVISAYHHWCCEFESRLGRGVTTLCDKVCQWLATSRWFSPGPPVSFTNKTDCHDITEILMKVTLYNIKQTNKHTRKPRGSIWETNNKIFVPDIVPSMLAYMYDPWWFKRNSLSRPWTIEQTNLNYEHWRPSKHSATPHDVMSMP